MQGQCTGEKDNLSDNSLVNLAKQGDVAAFEILLARYMPVVKAHANRYSHILGVELDDFMQEGMLALFKAVKGFREQAEVKFRTYAGTCIRNSTVSAMRHYMKTSHANQNVYLENIDEKKLQEMAAFTQVGLLPEDAFMEQEAAALYQRHITTLLSDFERKILKLYLGGHTYQQISILLCTTTKAVDNALQRVRRKLKTAYSD